MRAIVAAFIPCLLAAASSAPALTPAISVWPDSIGVTVHTGEVVDVPLTISNGGRSDLEWSSHFTVRAAADTSRGPGIRVLWDRSHQQNSTETWSSMVAELTARGATVTESFERITPTVLESCDVLWSINSWIPWEEDERAAITAWIGAGGALVFEGNANVSVAGFNTVLADIGAGIQYSTTDGVPGLTQDLSPHFITAGLTEINLGDDAGATLTSIAPPGAELVRDVVGNAMIGWSEVGHGRIVTMTVKALHDDNLYVSDNLAYGLQMFDWLGGVGWVSAFPTSGLVPPVQQATVTVSFDPTGYASGAYDAWLWIVSNDPDHGALSVPIHMDVATAPDIALSALALDFGEIPVDSTAERGLQIRNEGLDPLLVDSIDVMAVGAGTPYSLSIGSLILLPDESGTVVVTFAPAEPGIYPANLRIHSNDPDESLLVVPMEGTALGPTGVAIVPGEDAVLSVSAPRPNPSSGLTTTRIASPGGDVHCTIHDAQGRLVRTLLRGPVGPGSHDLTWDGLDERGQAVGAGVYFLRLEGTGQVRTRKVVQVRG